MNADASTETTSQMSGVSACKSELRQLLLHRKRQKTELQRLREKYVSRPWAETNQKLDAFIMELFTGALEGERGQDEWPDSDRFHTGISRVFDTHLPRLAKWVEKQKNLERMVAAPAQEPAAAAGMPPAEAAVVAAEADAMADLR